LLQNLSFQAQEMATPLHWHIRKRVRAGEGIKANVEDSSIGEE
jgi:hypothetical protein